MSRIPPNLLARAVAPVFVLIWSTGFIGARYGMPYAEPATFLALRFSGVLALMIPLALLMRATFPPPRQVAHLAVAGVLIQGGYLLGVFVAVRLGMGAGLAALIVGVQPILTGALAALVAERLTRPQWTGLVLGLAGVTLVVGERLSLAGLSVASLAAAVAALLSITLGTLYQRRYVPAFDLRSGSVVQFGAACLLVAPVSLLLETRVVEWTGALIGALLWSVLALSIGATSLLFLLIRRGAATRVASLMYLTPAVTAVMAWILFGERISAVMIAGMALAAVGVASMLQPGPIRRKRLSQRRTT